MLPSPQIRPQSDQHLAAYLEAQNFLKHAPVPYLVSPRRPGLRENTPLLNLYTPYRAHGSAPQTPAPHQQRALQENLLRRKTPAGTLAAAYDGAPVEWTTRPAKHILLPLSTSIRASPLQRSQRPNHGSPVGNGLPQLHRQNVAVKMQNSLDPSGSHIAPMGPWKPPEQAVWSSLDVRATGIIQNPAPQGILQQGQQLQHQPQMISPQQLGLYNNTGLDLSLIPPGQQQPPPEPAPTAEVENGMSSARPGGAWYLGQNVNAVYPQDGALPVQQLQLHNPFQMTPAYLPADMQQAPSYFGVVPTWGYPFRRDSGQAQTPQIINTPVTSPYHVGPFHPFVADPVHHTQPFIGVLGGPPIGNNDFQQQIPPLRNRVLAWAHKVYADLVHTTQVQNASQAGQQQQQSQTPTRVQAQGNSSHNASYQNKTGIGVQNTSSGNIVTIKSSAHSVLGAVDTASRRKKRKLDNSPDMPSVSPSEPWPGSGKVPGNPFSSNIGPNSGSVTPVASSFQKVHLSDESNPSLEHYSAYLQMSGEMYGHQAHSNSAGQMLTQELSSDPHSTSVLVPAGIGTNGLNHMMGTTAGIANAPTAKMAAHHALDTLQQLCAESGWRWLDGMLLGGCIAYALNDLNRALGWYFRIVEVDPTHVEALSNLGATLLALNRRSEAEEYWLKAVKVKPNYFEAVEHLVGLLCGDQRGKDAVALIEFVQRSVKKRDNAILSECSVSVCSNSSECSKTPLSQASSPEIKFDYFSEDEPTNSLSLSLGQPEYAMSGPDNGRLLGLIHTKGNMLYTLGDNAGAAKAFEDAVLVSAGIEKHGIKGLIQRILDVLAPGADGFGQGRRTTHPVLLTPEKALKTAKLVFPPHGELPGLREVPQGLAKKIAISTTSNSLLSLAKIFQDGMSSTTGTSGLVSAGVKDILALYYLSLSLHPSPSTANNVGILLASVQQVGPIPNMPQANGLLGYTSGSGVGLALLYYQYGLMLDPRHAHLYTNLGSLLKDINNLPMAIKMYEQAVLCDGTFDIALANLANAVKDQGRTNEAIKYYRRAVAVSPNFAEAVCGLANALNSVCDWKGRGGVVKVGTSLDRWHVNDDGLLLDGWAVGSVSSGWMGRVVGIVEKQLEDGENWGKGILAGVVLETLLKEVEIAVGGPWSNERRKTIREMLASWAGQKNEGVKVVRLIEKAIRKAGWRWYHDKYVRRESQALVSYIRPSLPAGLSTPNAPTVLPFHTFTCPLSAEQVRMISQRNGIRISCSTMRAPWVPMHVYPPPAPPAPHLNVGYISSDFNNHPLAHLMQSVFGMHDISRVKAHCYATTPSDNSPHRLQIEQEAPRFYDVNSWAPDRLIKQIIDDGIHILVNLNGFTRGAKNEIFAARPAPIQMSFMGFAGTLGADWCDYLLADSTAVPPETVRPWRRNVDIEDSKHEEDENQDWVYFENIVYTKHSFFCCDHRQSAPDAKGPRLSWEEEQQRRWSMRKQIFPDLPDDAVILGNFNQLYKIEPTTFRTWLRIISKVPNAYLWLLRFPDLGEKNLRELAEKWAGPQVARRIIFTDVAPKQLHIARARVCDIFLDTPECNAHTTAADVTWSGTPLLTLPRHKYKMCSRIAASIVKAAVPPTPEGLRIAEGLIANDEEEYERRAVELAGGLQYVVGGNGIGRGELVDIRKVLYEGRWTSPLFDTRRWVRDLETAYEEAWRRWVKGEGGDIWL